jgi:hypothetical protein
MNLRNVIQLGGILFLMVSCVSSKTALKVKTGKSTESIAQVEEAPMGDDHVEMKSASEGSVGQIDDENPALLLTTFKDNGFSQQQIVTENSWNSEDSEWGSQGRYHILRRLFYSNTRNAPLKGMRQQSCFEGSAEKVGEKFFGRFSGEMKDLSGERVAFKASQDGKVLALSFEDLSEKDSLGARTLRLYHCGHLKTAPTDYAGARLSPKNYSVYRKVPRGIASENQANSELTTDLNKAFLPKSHDRNYGFTMLDSTSDPTTRIRFTVRGDYAKSVNTNIEKPWRGLNLRDKTEALKFASLVKSYVLGNMANQSSQADDNLNPFKNLNSYWCHAPWKHVGPYGREAIHGLHYLGDYRSPSGTLWGLTLYNNVGCQTLFNIFGSITDPKETPDFSKTLFGDGTVAVQFVFTTAPLQKLNNSFRWHANVFEPGSRVRTVKSVRLLEMNISVKDTSLLGTLSELGHWAMLSYVFDPDYNYVQEVKRVTGMENPSKAIEDLPKSFLKLRPIGVQTGFDKPSTLDTVTFQHFDFLGVEGRLNSPSGNSRSSCLGCHATSGTSISQVPGFLNLRQYSPFSQTPKLDFNMELSTARSNWQTEISK